AAPPSVPKSTPDRIATPPPASAPSAATLLLKALPSGARIVARTPKGDLHGTGSLEIPELRPGTVILATASFANYEAQTRSFTVQADLSPQQHLFSLEKRMQGWGGLRVNAEPWGDRKSVV